MRRRKLALASHSMNPYFDIHPCLDRDGKPAHIYEHNLDWDDVVHAYRHMLGSSPEPSEGPYRHIFVGITRSGELIEVGVDEDVESAFGSYTALHAQPADNASFNAVGLTKKEIKMLKRKYSKRGAVPGVGKYDEVPISSVRYDMDAIREHYRNRPKEPVPGASFCPGPYFHVLLDMYDRGKIELYDDLGEDDGVPRAASR